MMCELKDPRILGHCVYSENIHNLKTVSYILFDRNFLGLQTQETASQVTLRELLQGGVGGSQVT